MIMCTLEQRHNMTGRSGLGGRRASKKSQMRDHGSLFEIKKYLTKKYRIKSGRILLDYVIKFEGWNPILVGRRNLSQIRKMTRNHLVHTPDITIVDENKKIQLVIELDGLSHNSEDKISKDEKRNEHYENADIPYIVINTANLRKEETAWYECLDEEMHKLGYGAEISK